MLSVFLEILPVFLLITTGYLLKKWFIQSENSWKFAEALTYNLLAPLLFAIIVNGADFSISGLSVALIATTSATFAIATVLFLTQLVFKVDARIFASIFQGGLRANSYIFLALAGLLYDKTGVAVAGVFVACTLVLSNIILFLVMNHYGSKPQKKIIPIAKAFLQNPLILGTTVGMTFSLLNVHFSDFAAVEQYLHYLGNAATPLNLLSVGASLDPTIQWQKLKWQKLTATAYASGLKLVIMPICTFLLLQLFSVTGIVANIAILYSAVPCAGNAYAISRKVGCDSETAISITTWTTLISAITITLLISRLA